MNKFISVCVSRKDLIKAINATKGNDIILGIETDSIEGDLLLWAKELITNNQVTIINKPRKQKDEA